MTDYERLLRLKHNEVAAKVNLETREVTVMKKRPNNIPDNREVFNPNGLFKKSYTKSWLYLSKNLNPFQFRIAFELALMAKANTNSLEPLNDDTTILQLVEKFGISRNKVKPLFKKLFDIGVYGKFEVSDRDCAYKKYWILNPYLSFSGKLIHSGISDLFLGTPIGRNYFDN